MPVEVAVRAVVLADARVPADAVPGGLEPALREADVIRKRRQPVATYGGVTCGRGRIRAVVVRVAPVALTPAEGRWKHPSNTEGDPIPRT